MQDRLDTHYWHFSDQHGWVVRDRTSTRPCPRCGGLLYRMPPRLVERLFGLRRRDRFQCSVKTGCWEGHLPIETTSDHR